MSFSSPANSLDFASKDETDVYLHLVDIGFDKSVAKVLQGMLMLAG